MGTPSRLDRRRGGGWVSSVASEAGAWFRRGRRRRLAAGRSRDGRQQADSLVAGAVAAEKPPAASRPPAAAKFPVSPRPAEVLHDPQAGGAAPAGWRNRRRTVLPASTDGRTGCNTSRLLLARSAHRGKCPSAARANPRTTGCANAKCSSDPSVPNFFWKATASQSPRRSGSAGARTSPSARFACRPYTAAFGRGAAPGDAENVRHYRPRPPGNDDIVVVSFGHCCPCPGGGARTIHLHFRSGLVSITFTPDSSPVTDSPSHRADGGHPALRR